MADTRSRPRLRESIAGEIRVAMVRRHVTGAALALALSKSEAYVSRRLSGQTAFDVDDLETIAATLQVKLTDLIGHAERGDGSYVNLGAEPTGREGELVVTGTFAHPTHPVIARALPLSGMARSLGRPRPAPTGR